MVKISFAFIVKAKFTGCHADMFAKELAKLIVIRKSGKRRNMKKLHAVVFHQKTGKKKL